MIRAVVRAMPATQLEQWRAARAAAGTPLPESPGSEQEAVTVTLDGVEVGGAVLAYIAEPSGLRCAVLLLQTTLPYDSTDQWLALAGSLEEHARRRGATAITTAVAPALGAAFGRAGFQVTMLGSVRPIGPTGWDEVQDDGRVIARPMDLAERRVFIEDLREMLHSGMTRAGVAEPGSVAFEHLEMRLAPLLQDPLPEDQLVLAAVIDGRRCGGLWATLAPGSDGGTEIHGHAMHLAPEYRGRGLGRSFLGAISTRLLPLGARRVRMRLYGFDQLVQHLAGLTPERLEEIHLRKEIAS